MWGKPSPFQPIDLAYVAAVLQKNHEVAIIDAPAEGWKNLQEIGGRKYRLGLTSKEISLRLKALKPNLVVITIPFSGWWETAFEAATIAKDVNKDIKTVLIGLHPTTRPEECLNQPNIDFVVTREPELTVLELADTLESGKTAEEDLLKIKGIGFLSQGKAVFAPPRPFIEDLDALPFPARDLLPLNSVL